MAAMRILAILLVLSISAAQAAEEDDPLFPQPLFSNDAEQTPIHVQSDSARDKAVQSEMRRQMRAVARYLQLYGIRNGSRFPGLQNDETNAARVQLTELVPNNPYGFATTFSAMAYGGLPVAEQTGSPLWGDQWTQELAAQQLDRIRLEMDFSLTPAIIDNYTVNPPQQWVAPPGTITAIGNNQGLFLVWGAGQDGLPIRNPINGRVLIITGSTSGTVSDQSAPNPGT